MSDLGVARHWVDGEWLARGELRDSVDPATGEVVGRFHDAPVSVAESAIAAARAAFEREGWRNDGYARATALAHLADAYQARLPEVVDTLCRENGKVRGEAGFEASLIPRALRFIAGLPMQTFGRVMETRPGQQSMSIREPVGVAGLIIPWNSPAYLCIRALGPALAAGCTTVVKMPHQAAHTAKLTAEIIASVPDFPKGVVNIFTESGADGAKLLVDSPHVPAISFTGSAATGRAIARAGAANFKRVGLELGGKTPHLIFQDADLSALLPVLEKSCTVFAGQFCQTGSRILVHRSLAEALTRGLAERLRAVRAGPASDAASHMGPLIDKAAVARVDTLVEAAIANGARPIVRGGPVAEGPLASGAFYLPALLEVDHGGLEIVREETFGPVQTVQVFDTEDEAVAMANDNPYGLSACVWSRDVDRPIRVARRLHSGLVYINSWANLAVEFEEGGYKASGSGRLGGLAAIDEFMEYKQITQDFVPHAH